MKLSDGIAIFEQMKEEYGDIDWVYYDTETDDFLPPKAVYHEDEYNNFIYITRGI